MILNYLQMTCNNSLDINEEVLNEKKWIKITPNISSPTSFYFYSIGNSSNKIIDYADIDDMVNRVLGIKNGTYKQSLDPKVTQKFKNELEKAGAIYGTAIDPKSRPYSAAILADPITAATPNVLSIRDRDMRRDAENIANADKSLKNKNGKVLVHHINGLEYDNAPTNLIVIDYRSEDDSKQPLALAQAVHAMLHSIQKNSNVDIKTELNDNKTVSCETQLRYLDSSTNVVKKKVALTISDAL